MRILFKQMLCAAASLALACGMTPALPGIALAGQPASQAEAAYQQASVSEAAAAIIKRIDRLPEAEDLVLGDKAAVTSIRTDYDALPYDDRQQVTNLPTLEAAEARIQALDEGSASTDATVDRLYGAVAYQTALSIVDAAFGSDATCDNVVLARDDHYADALSGSGLAGVLDAPLLLTHSDELPSEVRTRIGQLHATHVYILGGTVAVSSSVEEELESHGIEVSRICGDTIYETSLAISQKIVELGGSSDEAIVANPTAFQDAVSASSFAYRYHVPILLQTWGDTAADRGYDQAGLDFLAGRECIVLGGAAAVSDDSVSSLDVVHRCAGATAYDTSLAIAEYFVETGRLNASSVSIASGIVPYMGVDALAAAAIAGRQGGVVLLAQPNGSYDYYSTAAPDAFIDAHKADVRQVHVLGGAVVMPDAFFTSVQERLNSGE